MAWSATPAGNATILRQFLIEAAAALTEREKALTQYQSTATPLPYVVPDIQVEGDRFVEALSGGGFFDPARISLRTIQSRIWDMRGNFVQNKYSVGGADIDYDGFPAYSTGYLEVFPTWATCKDALGVAISFPPGGPTGVVGQSGFRRKFPAEINSLTATTYYNGEPAAVNDIARAIGGGNSPADRGKLFKCTAIGTWVPELVAQTPTIKTAWGLIQSGDYVGYWIAEDIKNALNLLVWTWGFITIIGLPLHPVYTGPVNVRFSMGSNLWHNRVYNATDGSGNPIPYVTQFTSGMNCDNIEDPHYDFDALASQRMSILYEWESYDPSYSAYGNTQAGKVKGYFKVDERNSVGLSNSVEYFAFTRPGYSDSPNPNVSLGNSGVYGFLTGCPITPHSQWKRMYTEANGAVSPDIKSAAVTTMPGLSVPPTAGSWGWELWPGCIVKYDVAGGFDYHV